MVAESVTFPPTPTPPGTYAPTSTVAFAGIANGPATDWICGVPANAMVDTAVPFTYRATFTGSPMYAMRFTEKNSTVLATGSTY